jgi:hypothetical protein
VERGIIGDEIVTEAWTERGGAEWAHYHLQIIATKILAADLQFERTVLYFVWLAR